VSRLDPKRIPAAARLPASVGLAFDAPRMLARMERDDAKLARVVDREVAVATHGQAPHVHVDDVKVPGAQHLGVFLSGTYCPEHSAGEGHDHGDHAHDDHDAAHDDHGAADHDHGGAEEAGLPPGCDPDCPLEPFSRILSASTAVVRVKR
jgi:hypothetical protein